MRISRLGIALLDVQRVVHLTKLSPPGLFESQLLASKSNVASQLHRQRACSGSGEIPLQNVRDDRDESPPNVETDMVEEVVVFGGDNGVAQHLWNVVVLKNDAALGRILADQLATSCLNARDGARCVVIELGNDGQVGRVGEESAGDKPQVARRWRTRQ